MLISKLTACIVLTFLFLFVLFSFFSCSSHTFFEYYEKGTKYYDEGNYIEALARYNQGGNWQGSGERYAFSIIREAEKIGIPLKTILLEEKMNFRTTISEVNINSSSSNISEEYFENNMY